MYATRSSHAEVALEASEIKYLQTRHGYIYVGEAFLAVGYRNVLKMTIGDF